MISAYNISSHRSAFHDAPHHHENIGASIESMSPARELPARHDTGAQPSLADTSYAAPS